MKRIRGHEGARQQLEALFSDRLRVGRSNLRLDHGPRRVEVSARFALPGCDKTHTPRPALVEHDQPGERCKTIEEVGEDRVSHAASTWCWIPSIDQRGELT